MATTPHEQTVATAAGELTLPSLPALALYAATLLVELPVLFARMLVLFALATILSLVKTSR